jgi:dihydropteroate synthase
MKLKLPQNKSLDLSLTKVMGTIVLYPEDSRTIEEIVELAHSFVRSGAELLEVGTKKTEFNLDDVDESRVCSVVEALIKELSVPIAVNTDNPSVVINAIKLGVSMIITSKGLDSEESIKAFKESEAVVCIHCEPAERVEDDTDVVSLISEFFYAKIDSLLNSGIARKRIVIDPSIINASVNSKLRLIGRLESFKSFALPICVGIPRQLPLEDVLLKENRTLSLTAAVFCASDKAVQIIRTTDVSEIAIAIGFWQIMSSKTKPYRLSKSIVRRLRTLRDAIRGLGKNHISK